MDSQKKFPTGKDGSVPIRPIAAFDVRVVGEVIALLSLDFADTPESLLREEYLSLVFSLTPQQALDIGEVLTRVAKRMLSRPLPPGTTFH